MRLNIRFLGILILVLVVLAGLTFGLHRYQVNRSANLILTLAREAREAGKISDSARLYRQYLALDLESAEAAAELGKMLASNGDLRDAYFQLDKSLRLDSEQPLVRNRLVEVALALGRDADAKQLLLAESAADLQQDPQRLWLLATTEESLREFDQARQHFEMAVAAAPAEAAYVKSLADLLVERYSAIDLAKQQLDRLVGEAPDDPISYLTRGRWSLERAVKINDRDLANQLLTAAWNDAQRGSELEPGNPELAILAADIAINRGASEDAKELVLEALKADSTLPELYIAMAKIEGQADDLEGAIEWFRKGLRELPENSDLLWNLSLLELESGNFAAVKEMLEQLRRQRYAEAPIRLLEARLLIANGEAREAADLLEKSRSLFDRTQNLLKQADFQLANCYRSMGNLDQELAALRRALGSDPLWKPAREALASALLRAGRLQESMSEYSQIVRRPNPSVGAVINYARLLLLDYLGKESENQDSTQLRGVLTLLDSIPEAAVDATVLRAELMVAKGQVERAEELLQNQIKDNPESLLARRANIELRISNQDWEQVEQALKAAKQAIGDSATLRLLRARYLVQRYGQQATEQTELSQLAEPADEWDEEQRVQLAAGFASLFLALEDYPACETQARVIADSKTVQPTLSVYLLLFDLALRSGNSNLMNEALARVSEIEGNGPLSRIGQAVRLTVEAQALPETEKTKQALLYGQALAELAEAEIERPAWTRIHRLRGDVYDRWGQPKLAVQSYLQAIDLGERSPELVSRAVFLLFNESRYVEADKIVRKLQEQQAPFSSELTRVASEVSLELENFDRALDLAKSWTEESDTVEDHVWLAQVYSISGDFATAQKEFRIAIEIDPTVPVGWVSLVQMLAGQADTEGARKIIREARQALPDEVVDDAIAQCFQAIKDYQQAEQSYRKALQASPQNSSLIRRFAEFYLTTDKFSDAEPMLLKLVGEESVTGLTVNEVDRSWARRNLGLYYGLRGDPKMFDRAEELIAANLERNERSLEDNRAKAIIYGNRRDEQSLDDAVDLLEDVIDKQPQFSLGDNFLLAEFYARQNDWALYSRTMRRVLGNGGADNSKYVRSYAAALLDQGELTEAQLWFDRLKSLAPGEQSTSAIEADLLFRSKEYTRLKTLLRTRAQDQANWRWSAERAEVFAAQLAQQDATAAEPLLALAEEIYARIANAEPEQRDILTAFRARQGQIEPVFERLSDPEIDPNTFAGICQLALQTGQLTDSQVKRMIASAMEALKRHPTNTALGLCLADLHGWLGNWKEATEGYQAVLAARPDSVPALNNMAMILAMSGHQLDQASRAVNQAITNLGATDFLYDTRGLVRLAAGRPKLAEKDFRASIETDARPDRLLHLAQALYAQQNIGEARKTLKRAQEAGISEQKLHPMERVAYRRLSGQL